MTDAVLAQHQFLGLQPPSAPVCPTKHPEAQWFPEAGLGLFIHWGIASVSGTLDLSWSMIANTPWDASAGPGVKTTPSEYWKLAEDFNPRSYQPEKWLSAAADAGFKYAVMTAMHHDGYTLWPSEASDFGVQSHLEHRDLLAPFIEACRSTGLRSGLYYSPIDWYGDRDWMSYNYPSAGKNHNSGAPHLDTHHRPVEPRSIPASHFEDLSRINRERITELLTRYGTIDMLWLDGGVYDNSLRDTARNIHPGIVLNHRACDGDFNHCETSFPKEPVEGWFEACHCWQESGIISPSEEDVGIWGYLDRETYKPASWVAEHYQQLRKWNMNFLVNISPRPDGTLPEIVYQRLQELKSLLNETETRPLTSSL